MDIHIPTLEQGVKNFVSKLQGGVIATDIWVRETGTSLAGLNQQPAAVEMFNHMTSNLDGTLAGSGFPPLHRYYMLDLENGHIVLIIRHGNDLLQGVLLQADKVNLGMLFAVALPGIQKDVELARKSA